MAVRKQPVQPKSEPPAAVALTPTAPFVDWDALPEDWRARHPGRTYGDETPSQHANRLRALAEAVPAKRERFLERAEQLLERDG
jgi:hypothetical protein